MGHTLRDDMIAALNLEQPEKIPVAPYVDYSYASSLSGIRISEVVLGSDKLKAEVLFHAYQRHQYNWILVSHDRPVGWQRDVAIKDLGDKYELHDKRSGERLFVLPKDGTPIYPVGDVTTENAAERFEFEILDRQDMLKQGRCEVAKMVSARAGREALVTGIVGAPFGEVLCRLGLTQGVACMYKKPDLIRELSELCLRRYVEEAAALSEVGVEAFWVEEVFAGTDTISPRHFEELALPSEASQVQALRRLGKPVIFYFCGNPMPIVEKLATLQADAFAFEENKKGIEVDIAHIKDVLGGQACLFGNFDALHTLRSFPSRIEESVKQMISKMAPAGGFVLGTGSPLAKDTRPENVDAMITATRKYGKYEP